MSNVEPRPCLEHQTEIGVTVGKKGEKIPATLIDVCQGDPALNTDKVIFSGTAVDTTTNIIENYATQRAFGWVLLINKESKFRYWIGIEANQNHVAECIRL